MQKLISLASILGLLVLRLAACERAAEPAPPPDAPAVGGVTISGTIVGYYYNVTSDVTVTVTQPPTNLSVQVTLTPGSGGLQGGAFSIPDVPEGTYNVVIVFESDNNYNDIPAYSIDGGVPVPADDYVISGASSPYTHTITFNGVPVSGDQTIDIDLGNVG